jgi:hypothetical protein
MNVIILSYSLLNLRQRPLIKWAVSLLLFGLHISVQTQTIINKYVRINSHFQHIIIMYTLPLEVYVRLIN